MITQARLNAIKKGISALPDDGGNGWYADITRSGPSGAVCHTESVRTLAYPQMGVCRLVPSNEVPIAKRGKDREALMDFIANARANVPALVEEVERLTSENVQVDAERRDLAMLVRRLSKAVSDSGDKGRLAARAMDYLRRKGLEGSILRTGD